MKHVYDCRRTFLALVGIIILGAALLMGKADTSMSLAGVVTAIAAANSYEKRGLKKPE